MDKHFCILNTENIQVINRLKQYGYEIVSTEKSDNVSSPISLHADVLYLKAEKREVYVSDCQNNNIKYLTENGFNVKTAKLNPGYKTESLLNIVIADNLILYNPKTAINISAFAENKKIIPVNQGYSKCSTIVLPKNNFITEDIGIYSALKEHGYNCLLIEKGYVHLKGYDYGFIGGASAYLSKENVLIFLGDITAHPDYWAIENFCKSLNVDISYIENMPLTDIGGIIEF